MEDVKEKNVGGMTSCENCKSEAVADTKDENGGCCKAESNCCSNCKPSGAEQTTRGEKKCCA